MGATVHPLFTDAARPLRHATGDRWFVDETYVKVAGRWRYLYRAVDQYGQVIDVLLADSGTPRPPATDVSPPLRLATAFSELALAR